MKVKITIELDADDDQEALVELLEVLKDIQQAGAKLITTTS